MKITPNMVGLEFSIVNCVEIDNNEYRLKIKFEELSEEGLEIFGLSEEDVVE